MDRKSVRETYYGLSLLETSLACFFGTSTFIDMANNHSGIAVADAILTVAWGYLSYKSYKFSRQ